MTASRLITMHDVSSLGSSIIIDPRMHPYNAKADVWKYNNGTINSGALNLLVLQYIGFQLSAVTIGNCIRVIGAGAAGVDLVTTIAAYNSTTNTITLASPAASATTAACGEFGTDDSAAINSAITANSFTNPYQQSGPTPTSAGYGTSDGSWLHGPVRIVLASQGRNSSLFGISSPLLLATGCCVDFDWGVALAPLGNFSGTAAIYQQNSSGTPAQIANATLRNPRIVANNNCAVGVRIDYANSFRIIGDLDCVGVTKTGLLLGLTTTTTPVLVWEVTGSINLYATAYNYGQPTYPVTDPTGVGVLINKGAYDGTVAGDVHSVGYYTGYADYGGNNRVDGTIHAWTGKYVGYMTTAIILGGSNYYVGRCYVDSPVAPAGTTIYGVVMSGYGKVNEITSTINPTVGTLDNSLVLLQHTYTPAAGSTNANVVDHLHSVANSSIKIKQVVQNSGTASALKINNLTTDGNYYSVGWIGDIDTINASASANTIAIQGQITTINSTLPGAAWTPSQLGSAVLAWFSADYGVAATGGAVTAWADHTGAYTATVATSSTSPTYNASGWDGTLPCLTFDGAVSGNMLSFANLPTTTDISIFAVVRRGAQNTTETSRCPIFTAWTNNGASSIQPELDFLPSSGDSGQTLFSYRTAGGSTTTLAGPGIGVKGILEGFFSSDFAPVGATGVGVNAATIVANTQRTGSTIAETTSAGNGGNLIGGSAASTSRRAAFDLVSLIIVSGVLSDANRQRIEGYLAKKWFGAGAGILPSSATYYNAAPANPSALTSFLNIETPIFSLLGANMNSTADQQFTLRSDLAGQYNTYQITSIRVVLASGASLTTAAGGIYSAASKGGAAYVASTQTYTPLSTVGYGMLATLTAAALGTISGLTAPYLSLTTAQGAAATANIFIYGIPLS